MSLHDLQDAALIPLPRELQRQAGKLSLEGGFRLDVQETGDGSGASRVADQLSGWLIGLGVCVHRGGVKGLGFSIKIDGQAAGHAAEGYSLVISPGGVVLSAGDSAGLFYGAQTLRQLVAAAGQGELDCMSINDEPRFPWRGFMLDSARHFQPVRWIKRHLDRMASLKLNRLHWHLSDDHSWRAEIKRYPRLTELASWPGAGEHQGFYTQQDMRDIVAYAADLKITVIPEIDTPAHCNAALVAYPELSCDGRQIPIDEDAQWQAFTAKSDRRAFCAGGDEAYAFLEGVWSELAEVFGSPYLHLGGDETPEKAWDGCPKCSAVKKQRGIDSAGLRLHFMNRLADFCRQQLGLPTIGWTEGVSDQSPKDQIIQAWFPGEAAEAARLGYDVLNSNHEWTYMDYPASDADRAQRPDWMPVLPIEKVYHFAPIPDGLEKEHWGKVLGSELALWTECLPDEVELEKQIMPRLLAFAEVMWTPRLGCAFDGFTRRMDMMRAPGRRSALSISA